jgi:NAD(P)-dependent dehydrogenase (short-subunit alcohol dehydrogenase family)
LIIQPISISRIGATMTTFDPAAAPTANLRDKVIVLTGGATGIGAATVSHFCSLGAKVIFGDINVPQAESLVQTLAHRSPSSDDPGVHFLKCDVRSHADNLALFKLAMNKYGRIEHAIANAGVMEEENWFDPSLGIEGVEKDPGDPTTLDVNLKALVLFARIACQYLAHGNETTKEDKSLVLLSSLAGFLASAAIPLYQASKHGVLGLMRSLQHSTPTMFHGLRVNAVCPGFVRTGMTKTIHDLWLARALPVNEPSDVAELIAGLCAAGPGSKCLSTPAEENPLGEDLLRSVAPGGKSWNVDGQGVHGRAVYIEGGKSWEIEEGLDLTMPIWMGKGPAERTRGTRGILQEVMQGRNPPGNK